MKKHLAVLLICLVVIATAFAHEGMRHIMGTVTQVSFDSITVKTTNGALVTVAVAADTQFMKDKAEVKIADVKVGDRVVIEAKKDAKDATKLVAHMVMIGQMDSMAHHDAHR